MKTYTRGFTLIELLVVIAIIGILSSVVLVSLNSARTKGNDAKTQSQLAGFRSAAEIFYSDNSGYSDGTAVLTGTCPNAVAATSAFASTNGLPYILAANLPSGVTTYCYHNGTVGTKATKYILLATKPSDTTKAYCVDSSGNSKEETATAYDTSAEVAALATPYACN